MPVVLKLMAVLLGPVVAVCTAYEFYLFFERPLKFWHRHHEEGEFTHPYKLTYVPMWGLLFGIGVCIFQGTQFALSWMPRNWLLEDIWAPTVIPGFAAVFGACALVLKMEKFNSAIISGSLTREKILKNE